MVTPLCKSSPAKLPRTKNDPVQAAASCFFRLLTHDLNVLSRQREASPRQSSTESIEDATRLREAALRDVAHTNKLKVAFEP